MKPLRGHCLCGYVRYEYVGLVGPATYCHCEDCRRCTGSAFNVGVRLETAALRMLGGQPKGHTRRGESGGDQPAKPMSLRVYGQDREAFPRSLCPHVSHKARVCQQRVVSRRSWC